MAAHEEEIVVRLDSGTSAKNVLKVIWSELTSGIGIWGSMRPIFAVILALVPFLYLGQHFNREHRKAFDWSLLQFPLILTIIFAIGLWIWSIFDAWYIATEQSRSRHNRGSGAKKSGLLGRVMRRKSA
ncbi:MAG: hypothetical protein HOE92_05350 [Euryarchaeota archaeon]|nr:hypothetical protein [Euryarchaeota archaeon]MBT6644968.1 hypothetical protein [Euryarchaeota archaeon]